MERITFDKTVQEIISPSASERKVNEQSDVQSFGGMLKGALAQVDQLHKEADHAIQELAAGEEKDIHKTMIALEKAEISFQLMMQVRNKIIRAYEEIMRMQV